MICRCSSHEEHVKRQLAQTQRLHASAERDLKKKVVELEGMLDALTLAAENYEVMRVESLKGNLVMWVKYPGCTHTPTDKVMVFLGKTANDALMWKAIDPHFDAEGQVRKMGCSPAPNARFPATEEGWNDALMYAGNKPS